MPAPLATRAFTALMRDFRLDSDILVGNDEPTTFCAGYESFGWLPSMNCGSFEPDAPDGVAIVGSQTRCRSLSIE